MINFNFYSPTEFVFGKNTEEQVGQLVRKYGGSKVLIHYGGGSVQRSGLYDKTVKSLEAEGISHISLGGARPNPVDSLVYEGITLCRNEGVDFVLGIGGGSAIDSAKAIAVGVPYKGDFWDFFSAKAKPQEILKVGCILTLPATGTEGSDSTVITKEDGMLKRGLSTDLNRPLFSIMNPELTMSLPEYQTGAGAADMLCHILERYHTNTKNVEITDRISEAIMQTIVNNAPKLMDHPGDYDARAEIMWSGMLAHNNICGVGRVHDFSMHQIEHELSALYDVTHGAGLAAIMPAWIEYQMDHNPMRFAQFAVRVFGCPMNFENPTETAQDGVRKLAAFLRSIAMPVNLQELDNRITREDIPAMVAKVKRKPDGTVGNFRPLDENDITRIYERSFDWNG